MNRCKSLCLQAYNGLQACCRKMLSRWPQQILLVAVAAAAPEAVQAPQRAQTPAHRL